MTRRWCDKCMCVHGHGERCPQAPKRKAKPDKRKFADRHPSRANYSSAEYQRNRQRVLTKYNGKCALCGKTIATRKGGVWKCQGGDIHHMKALIEGGSNEIGNLVPLCRACHAKSDADRRRRSAT